MNKNKTITILNKLKDEYPEAECALGFENVFQLLVAVTLSAQTTDVSVNKVTPLLFDKYPSPREMAGADLAELQKILKPVGMYKTKSNNIKKQSIALLENFNGKVPNNYEDLISLPGVGRKTANVVLSVGFGEQRIAVDTHVFRVSNRIGLVNEKDVLKTELSLMKVIPEDRWSETHHSLIFHGRNCCTARNPNCDSCVISNLCEFFLL
ncbi:MAG: endonuclease III [Anaerovoracaceae bacterium]